MVPEFLNYRQYTLTISHFHRIILTNYKSYANMYLQIKNKKDSKVMSEVSIKDVAYLDEAATNASPEDVLAARELLREAASIDKDAVVTHIDVVDDSGGKLMIPVTSIGSMAMREAVKEGAVHSKSTR